MNSQSFDVMSMDGSEAATPKREQTKKEAESPAEESKAQIAKIEAELTKILKDKANESMSYAGSVYVRVWGGCKVSWASERQARVGWDV